MLFAAILLGRSSGYKRRSGDQEVKSFREFFLQVRERPDDSHRMRFEATLCRAGPIQQKIRRSEDKKVCLLISCELHRRADFVSALFGLLIF
jgi:hypothetical protein